MNEGNPGEIDFGSSQFEVRVIGGRLYLQVFLGRGFTEGMDRGLKGQFMTLLS